MMTPWDMSVRLWWGGAIIGAIVAKKHRVKGAILGSILVGSIGDKYIELHHPDYTGSR